MPGHLDPSDKQLHSFTSDRKPPMSTRGSSPFPLTTKLLPTDARLHNRALVLRTLERHRKLSRADIARITGLSRITISDLVADLIDEQLIVDLGLPDSLGKPGKPATLLQINASGFNVVSADLSRADAIVARVTDIGGEILSEVFDAPLSSADNGNLDRVVGLLARAVGRATAPIIGIGVGTPGIVSESGTVIEATTPRWSDVPMSSILSSRFELPVIVENDANTAIIAESMMTASDDLVLVRIGRGLGAAIMIDKRLVRGSHGATGEFGQVRDVLDPRFTVEGKIRELSDQLEAILSAKADAHEVERLQAEMGTVLGRALAPIVSMLDVKDTRISGAEALGLDKIITSTREQISQLLAINTRNYYSVSAALSGDDIVLRGALALITDRFVYSPDAGRNRSLGVAGMR